MHYWRWLNYGRLHRVLGYAGKPCMIEKCHCLADVGGMCRMHYNRVKRHGTPYAYRGRDERTGDLIGPR